MRVTQTNNSQVQGSESSSAKKTGRAGQAQTAKKSDGATGAESTASSSSGSARAEISDKAKDLSKAKAVAGETPDVREEKIAELKRRIAAGKYNVDPQAVADRMVDEHLSAGIG